MSVRQITSATCLVALMLVALMLLAGVTLSGWYQALRPHSPAGLSHFSGPVPPPPPSRCADCHQEQVESLRNAPHSLTLQAVTADDVRQAFAGESYRDPSAGRTTDSFIQIEQQLVHRRDDLGTTAALDWVLGSGQHARTPVSLRTNAQGQTELLEHRISWYPGVGLDRTLGATQTSTSDTSWQGLGRRLSATDAADCLGCHASWLPQADGQIQLAQIVPGVQCTRCHTQAQQHLTAVSLGEPDARMERWSELTPLESIRRCGECHRRDDHLTPFELRPDNSTLIRLAPVGLSQSPCFVKQDQVTINGRRQRLDCMTCHDPHQPAETSAEYYVARCLNCHGSADGGSADGQARGCSSRDQTQQCLDCHMPKVEVQTHLQFTDHWIRIRTPTSR